MGRPRSFPVEMGWADDETEIVRLALRKLAARESDPVRRNRLSSPAITTMTAAVHGIVGTKRTRDTSEKVEEKADLLAQFVALILGRCRLSRAHTNALRDAVRARKAWEIGHLIKTRRFCQPDLYVRAMSKSARAGKRPVVALFMHR